MKHASLAVASDSNLAGKSREVVEKVDVEAKVAPEWSDQCHANADHDLQPQSFTCHALIEPGPLRKDLQ
jgi:hypothetical protein